MITKIENRPYEEFVLSQLEKPDTEYDYSGILDQYSSIFGLENLKVKEFNYDKMIRGDIQRDFMKIRK